MTGPASVEEAEEQAQDADAILLDSGNPAARVKELGGTGRRHDWALSAEIVTRVSRPVFLAGGLTPENAVEAIRTVQPWGLDVCSGVRTDGTPGRGEAGAAVRGRPLPAARNPRGVRSGGQASLRSGSGSAAVDAGVTPATRPAPPRRRYWSAVAGSSWTSRARPSAIRTRMRAQVASTSHHSWP